MTSSNQNRSIHWFNKLAVKDRIDASELDNTKQTKSVFDLYNADFIPSVEHNTQLLHDIIPLFARVIVNNIPALRPFRV